MLKLFVTFVVGVGLLGAVAIGPTVFRGDRISSLKATSVRVQSIPKPRPRRSGGGVYIGGGGSSSRYSSGGGFSSGK